MDFNVFVRNPLQMTQKGSYKFPESNVKGKLEKVKNVCKIRQKWVFNKLSWMC